MCWRCSRGILLGQEHGAAVEQVRSRGVSIDQENFGNVSVSWSALDKDNDIERIGDVGLNRAIREVHTALQNAGCEPREALLSGICMDGRQRPRVPGVQELQEVEGFATTNLPEHDTVRPVAEGRFQEVTNGHCRKAVLFPAGLEPDEIFLRKLNLGRIFDDEDAFVWWNELSEDRK